MILKSEQTFYLTTINFFLTTQVLRIVTFVNNLYYNIIPYLNSLYYNFTNQFKLVKYTIHKQLSRLLFRTVVLTSHNIHWCQRFASLWNGINIHNKLILLIHANEKMLWSCLNCVIFGNFTLAEQFLSSFASEISDPKLFLPNLCYFMPLLLYLAKYFVLAIN